MATCKQTAYELIQDVFSPCVAVLCSNDVEQICAKNNLTFVEMVQPFCRLNTEVTIRDPSNMPSTIKNFRVTMKDLRSQPHTLSVGKKMMYDAVASNVPSSPDGILMNTLSTENYHLKYCSSTPWFEAYREVFFQVTSPTEHEFVHNYLSCVFVVSSSHQDPLSQINELSQQLVQHQQNSLHNSKWFFSFIFTYYLLLHDVSSEDLGKAEAVYQSMKSSYGSSSCHLLQINSATPSAQNANSSDDNNATIMPDPWSQFLLKFNVQNELSVNSMADGIKATESIHHPLLYNSDSGPGSSDSVIGGAADDVDSISGYVNKFHKNSSKLKRHGLCLTLSDMDRIKCFVQEFCIQGLIPFIEKQVRSLNEQVANRKGIHRTIFGVTKKFFGNKQPGSQNPASSLNSVVYGPDAPELQVRKLGDLAFMFQMYEVAYQAYHNAKRDFSADQAWLHFAGASEMAALSVFMQNSSLHEYPARYIESAITTYLHTCKLPELATRATFLSTECLKAKGLYRDAATQFIRMPSEADLPSALCLEQAAYCYINCKPSKVRKYAFHIILAGHRFSKAGQRKHALRSYKQAEQVYNSVGWNFANNHINFTIGRLSVQLEQLESACTAFEPLLVSKCQLPAAEQANYLREYLFVLKRLISKKSDSKLPTLPVPLINADATKILLSEDSVNDENGAYCVTGRGFDRGDLNNNIWMKLEEIIASHALNNPVYTTQLQCFTNRTSNVSRPNAIVDEVISIEMSIKNPLSVNLVIEDVYPLWTFSQQSEGNEEAVILSNEIETEKDSLHEAIVKTTMLPKVSFEPHEEKKIHLLLVPQQVGSLSIKGLAYSLLAHKSVDDTTVDSTSEKQTSVLSLCGKQCLNVKGPRLNKSTEERSTLAYAEDNRLNINVLSPMAKLQVKFNTFPHSLFCGEIQKVTATFTNVGKQKLRRIIAASPTPGIFAIGTAGETSEPHTIFKERSARTQPIPVIASWESDWMTEILMPGGESCSLSPGDSIDVPFWFKGPELPGDHDLDILFYYESEPSNHKLKYRLLQLSSILITYPSVSVQSKAMRSFCSEDKLSNFHPAAIPSSLLLSVEVGNISQDINQISLAQISCISKNWCFMPTEDNCRRGLSVIHPDEMLLLTLKAIGFDPKTTVSSQEVRVFSHIPMGRVEVDSSSTPCSDFSQKSGLDLGALLYADNSKGALSVRDCNNKLKTETDFILLLVLIWKAKVSRNGKDVIITGQHHVPIQNLVPSSVPVKSPSQVADIALQPPETEVEQLQQNHVPSELMITAMLQCSLNHPFSVQHNFTVKKTVIVPVDFIIRSTSDVEISVVLDNASQHDSSLPPFSPDGGFGKMSRGFSWVSGSRREVAVKPHATIHLPLRAMFCAPGTYNLNSLNLLVKFGENAQCFYTLPAYLIIINPCDTT
ncbi:trafficking protein particle complex subunit 8-like [Uloborus diversus]|uniref:trafficking protein particle complex subunit 8-like n=1 Tax=Uloborus diversus TaxID=327109 RepID=UPI002409B8B6|nr:trafficking protein particle complex subunit 8-like [Uloborus diversus]